MKRTLALLLVCIGVLAANFVSAQLPDGTQAPDFTATDLNGTSHTLSSYINAGKTVILDISATWCGPCWNYHNSHALREIWAAYGPDGSDEVMVFFVEGDASTTTADLHGTGTNTQGDWVSGTPYPILDNAQIANDYAINYFPTLYRICPNGLVYEIDQLDVAGIVDNISANCGVSAVEGVSNHAQIKGSEIALCANTSTPEVVFTNFGNNAITTATVILKENGNTVSTTDYFGNVTQFATGSVAFPELIISSNSDYTVELTAINGGLPHLVTTDTMSIISANLAGLTITINVHTDHYPSEISWTLKNSNGSVVAEGGPYQAGTDDPYGGGGPDADTVKSHAVTLPVNNDCYTIELHDGYGDGWSVGNTDHGVTIESLGDTVLNLMLTVDNFGSELVRHAALKTDATSGLSEFIEEEVSVYPNPVSNNLTVKFNGQCTKYTVALTDLSGREVYSETTSNLIGVYTIVVPVSSLKAGSYLLQLFSNKGIYTERVVVN